MKKLSILLFASATLLFTACNSDNSTNDTLTTDTDSMSAPMDMQNNNSMVDNDDDEFAKKAARGGMMEVEMGKIAVEKATNQEVKDFGQKMIDDHSKANEELKSLAASKNIVVPTMLDDGQQKDLNDLREKSGADFEKKYVSLMVDDHKEDVDDFQKAVDKLKDEDLKKFAINTLPTLQMHLATIEKLHDKIK